MDGSLFNLRKTSLLWNKYNSTRFCCQAHEEEKHLVSGESTSKAVSLQVVPAEFSLKAGTNLKFDVFTLDAQGRRIKKLEDGMSWKKWIPPTAKVKSKVDATISEEGVLVAKMDASLSAGALQVTSGKLTGITRGRVIPSLPYSENFEDGFELSNTSSDQIAFSYPPLSWLG